MEKVTFKEFVSVENICEKYDMVYVDEDWFKGDGVYKFVLGCRGELDNIVKVSDDNSFMLKNKEEIIKELREEWEKGLQDGQLRWMNKRSIYVPAIADRQLHLRKRNEPQKQHQTPLSMLKRVQSPVIDHPVEVRN